MVVNNGGEPWLTTVDNLVVSSSSGVTNQLYHAGKNCPRRWSLEAAGPRNHRGPWWWTSPRVVDR